MAITGAPSYTTLAHVERVLRTAQKKTNFSNVYRDLKTEASTGTLAKVTLGSSYSGYQRFEIKFNSSTAFEVFLGNVQEGVTSIGTGTVSVAFASDNSEISIAVVDWTGPFTSSTIISLRSTIDMSDDDATLFIVEAERYVDAKARLVYSPRISVTSASEEALIFTTHVPSIVDISTSRYASFLIFDSIFATERNEDEQPTNFEKQADSLIKILVTRLEHTLKSGPQWTARTPLFPDTKVQFRDISETEGKDVLLNEYGIGIDRVEEGIREWKKNVSQTLLTA